MGLTEGAAQKFDLAAIEALSELEKAATPGPLKVVSDYPGVLEADIGWRVLVQDQAFPEEPRYTCEYPRYTRRSRIDCELAAALRNAAPSLLALAREALAARGLIEFLRLYGNTEFPDGADHEIFEVMRTEHRKIVAAHTSSEGK